MRGYEGKQDYNGWDKGSAGIKYDSLFHCNEIDFSDSLPVA